MVSGEVMPALRRSINTVIGYAWAEIRRIAKEEGDDGMRMMEHLDLTADVNNGRDLLEIAVEFKKEVIWRSRVPITRANIDFESSMSNKELQDTLSVHMRKQLSLVAQLHHARLDKLFPGAISGVRLGYIPATAEKIIIVTFKNGHEAEATETESKTDLFTARCLMLYDLPPK